jgi:hypothetical protein
MSIGWREYVQTFRIQVGGSNRPLTYIDRHSFSVDKTQPNRFTLLKESAAYELCEKVFPWFPCLPRYRETLATEPTNSCAVTLDEVIDAMNYFSRRTFTAEDVAILREIYENMEPPTSSESLKSIVSVQRKFIKKLDERSSRAMYAPGAGSDADDENATSVREFRRKALAEIRNLSSMIERNCEEICYLSAYNFASDFEELIQVLTNQNQGLHSERERLLSLLE